MPVIDFGNEFKGKYVGKGVYKVYFESTTSKTRYIGMTGSAVTKHLKIPFPHRWIRFQLVHTTSSDVLNNTAFSIEIYKRQGGIFPTNFKDHLFRAYDLTPQSMGEWFGEGWEYESGEWTIILNGTNTRRIYPLFYIQKIGDN